MHSGFVGRGAGVGHVGGGGGIGHVVVVAGADGGKKEKRCERESELV